MDFKTLFYSVRTVKECYKGRSRNLLLERVEKIVNDQFPRSFDSKHNVGRNDFNLNQQRADSKWVLLSDQHEI